MLPPLRSWLGLLLGGLLGWGYYLAIGCWTGSCWITGDPILSAGYFGLFGWFLAGGARWMSQALRRRPAG